MTIPSASPAVRSRLCSRIACETTGVGVGRSSAWMRVSTPLPSSTSTAVDWATPDSAWVSLPISSGPSIPLAER